MHYVNALSFNEIPTIFTLPNKRLYLPRAVSWCIKLLAYFFLYLTSLEPVIPAHSRDSSVLFPSAPSEAATSFRP